MRATSILIAFLQVARVSGSANGSRHTSRALLPTPPGPLQLAMFGEILAAIPQKDPKSRKAKKHLYHMPHRPPPMDKRVGEKKAEWNGGNRGQREGGQHSWDGRSQQTDKTTHTRTNTAHSGVQGAV